MPKIGRGNMVPTALRKETENSSARRRELLDGAAELFTRKGYAATSVREIVAAARVTKPVLYYYFRNKEGIYLELMKEAFGKMDALLEASRGDQGSATQKLLGLCTRVYALFMENVKVARVMYSIYYGPPQGAPFFDFNAHHIRFLGAIRRLIDEGMRKKEFRKGNAEEMVWAIIGAINVAVEVHLSQTAFHFGREGLARVLRLIFSGMSAKKGARK